MPTSALVTATAESVLNKLLSLDEDSEVRQKRLLAPGLPRSFRRFLMVLRCRFLTVLTYSANKARLKTPLRPLDRKTVV